MQVLIYRYHYIIKIKYYSIIIFYIRISLLLYFTDSPTYKKGNNINCTDHLFFQFYTIDSDQYYYYQDFINENNYKIYLKSLILILLLNIIFLIFP